jgi:Subtilase family
MSSNATWRHASTGDVTSTQWDRWLPSGRPIDPYLVWADLTAFAGLGGFNSGDLSLHNGKLPLLVESVATPVFEGVSKPVAFALLEIPRVYDEPLRNGSASTRARFFTARVLPSAIDTLLMCADSIKRFQLGLPRIPFNEGTEPGLPFLPRTPPVVVGVIDDGCAFVHQQFLDGTGTRVRFLWDQDPAPSPPDPWAAPAGLDYGRELKLDDLAGPLVEKDRDESAVYASLDYRRVAWRSGTHGTATLDLFAGDEPPVALQQSASARSNPNFQAALDYRREGRPPEVDRSHRDNASDASIVFVQLPARSVLDTSGGSLGVHTLDGVRYIINRADTLYNFNDDSQRGPVVANISFGSIAGPHDGTSMIEEALAELVQLRERLAIVVAAGNAHGSKTHAALALEPTSQLPWASEPPDGSKPRAESKLAPSDSHEVTWHVAPDNPHESYLEIWLPSPASDSAMVKIQPPGDGPVQWIRCGQAFLLTARTEPGPAIAGGVFARNVAQGTNGTMVLVAVGPTRPYDRRAREPDLMPPFVPPLGASASSVPRPTAPAGAWRIEVFNGSVSEMKVHLWTERNDLVGRSRRRQQSYLSDEKRHAVQSDHSLSSLANRGGPTGALLSVGGYRLSDGKMAPYSSGGPTLGAAPRLGPNVEAPSDLGLSLPGLRTAGTRSHAFYRLGGTSAAAPLLARWIVNQADHWHDSVSLAKLLDIDLKKPQPDRIEDTPPWPDPMPLGVDDAARRGRYRLK